MSPASQNMDYQVCFSCPLHFLLWTENAAATCWAFHRHTHAVVAAGAVKNLQQQFRQIRRASSFKRGFLKCRHYDPSIRTSIAITNKMNNSDATASASLNNYWSRIITRGDPSQTYSHSWRERSHLWDKHLELAHMLSAQWIWPERCFRQISRAAVSVFLQCNKCLWQSKRGGGLWVTLQTLTNFVCEKWMIGRLTRQTWTAEKCIRSSRTLKGRFNHTLRK